MTDFKIDVSEPDGYAGIYEHAHQQSMSKDPEESTYGKGMKDMLPILERYVDTELPDGRMVAMLAVSKVFATMLANIAGAPPKKSGIMFLLLFAIRLDEIISEHSELVEYKEIIRSVLSKAFVGKGDEARDELVQTVMKLNP